MLLAAIVSLTGCVGAPGPRPFAQGGGRPTMLGGGTLSTAAPSGKRVAILAPLSGPNAERGNALVKAAQLALSGPGSPALDVQDTGGTASGAAAAAATAINAGAGLIIGPLTASETSGAAGPAQKAGVAVLAFTSDPAQARPGVWVLGLTPAQQVRRLVGAASSQGKNRFAAVLPENEFGQAMAAALTQAAQAANAGSPDIRFHGSGMASISSTVRDISAYGSRRGPVDAEMRAARSQGVEGRKRATELSRASIAPPPFDVLLLADTGEQLNAVASMLSYYDVDSGNVRIMGPALWASPTARGGAPLGGAWFAAPDPSSRENFDAAFTAAAGTPAPGLADFAYDAANIARVLAAEGGFSAAALCRPEGFAGVDGVLALQPDGTVTRGLALFEIRRGGPVMIEPAPVTAAPGT